MARKDAGRAMAELRIGDSNVRAEDAARELSSTDLNAPAFEQLREELRAGMGDNTQIGTIPEIEGIPPEAIEAARQALVTEGGRGEVQSPPAPAILATPQTEQPTPLEAPKGLHSQAVDLNSLYESPTPAAPAPVAQAPVAQTPSPIAPVAVQPTPVAPTPSRVVADDNLIIVTPEGEKTWREIEGERMLKQKFSKSQVALLEKERSVDLQREILNAAAKSDYARNLVEALRAGHSEERAIQIATAAALAAGKSIPAAVQSAPEPEPEFPSDQDPEFTSKIAKFFQFQVQKGVAPLKQQMQSLQEVDTQKTQDIERAQAARRVTIAENDRLFESLVDPYLPQNMTNADKQVIAQYLVEVGKDNFVPVDPDTYATQRLRPAEVAHLAERAFPNGQIPQVIAQRLSAAPAPQIAPPVAAPQQPSPATWGALSAMQQQAVARQIALNESVIVQQRQLGYLRPPGIPQEPVLNAGPNPSAINVGSTQLGGSTRADSQIAQRLGSLSYKD